MRNDFDITKGDVLSLDPGTNVCGVALWRDGGFIDSRPLRATSTDLASDRLRSIQSQLEDFLALYSANVMAVVSEHPTNENIILVAMIGAILSAKGVNTTFSAKNTVSASEWKIWARQRGASHPDGFKCIKGIAALKSTGFKHLPSTDDEADAIMVYLAYKAKYGASKTMRTNRRNTKAPEAGAGKRARVSRKGVDRDEVQGAAVAGGEREVVDSKSRTKRNARGSAYTVESLDRAIPLDLQQYERSEGT